MLHIKRVLNSLWIVPGFAIYLFGLYSDAKNMAGLGLPAHIWQAIGAVVVLVTIAAMVSRFEGKLSAVERNLGDRPTADGPPPSMVLQLGELPSQLLKKLLDNPSSATADSAQMDQLKTLTRDIIRLKSQLDSYLFSKDKEYKNVTNKMKDGSWHPAYLGIILKTLEVYTHKYLPEIKTIESRMRDLGIMDEEFLQLITKDPTLEVARDASKKLSFWGTTLGSFKP